MSYYTRRLFFFLYLALFLLVNKAKAEVPGSDDNGNDPVTQGHPVHDPGSDPDCEDKALEALVSSSTARQLSFSKRLPFICHIKALRRNVLPLDDNTIAEIKVFLNSAPRDLVQLNAEQLLWFTTQGAQDCRLISGTQPSPQRKKRFVLPQVDFPQQQFPTLELQWVKFLRRRKEVRQMSQEEWDNFVEAVLAMRSTFPGNGQISEYDILANFHNYENSPGAHSGYAFAPWHREYLLKFENALRKHSPNVAIPYWDSNLDSPLPNPAHSVLWHDVLLGNNQGQVVTGPFKNFASLNHPECLDVGATLTRSAASSSGSNLFSQEKLQDLFSKETYGEFRIPLESYHNTVHVYVKGHMLRVACAPMDPIFYMHHNFIDLLWEEFRQDHQESDPQSDYPDDLPDDHPHAPFTPMAPFEPKVNVHGLSNIYTNWIYTYEPRPSKGFCVRDSQCKSRYLWCDLARCRCTSKVRPGGDCTGLSNRACYCRTNPLVAPPMCVNDICQCGPGSVLVDTPFSGK